MWLSSIWTRSAGSSSPHCGSRFSKLAPLEQVTILLAILAQFESMMVLLFVPLIIFPRARHRSSFRAGAAVAFSIMREPVNAAPHPQVRSSGPFWIDKGNGLFECEIDHKTMLVKGEPTEGIAAWLKAFPTSTPCTSAVIKAPRESSGATTSNNGQPGNVNPDGNSKENQPTGNDGILTESQMDILVDRTLRKFGTNGTNGTIEIFGQDIKAAFPGFHRLFNVPKAQVVDVARLKDFMRKPQFRNWFQQARWLTSGNYQNLNVFNAGAQYFHTWANAPGRKTSGTQAEFIEEHLPHLANKWTCTQGKGRCPDLGLEEVLPYFPKDVDKAVQVYGALKGIYYLHMRQELISDVAEKLEHFFTRECPNLVNDFMVSKKHTDVGCILGKVFLSVGLLAGLTLLAVAVAAVTGGAAAPALAPAVSEVAAGLTGSAEVAGEAAAADTLAGFTLYGEGAVIAGTTMDGSLGGAGGVLSEAIAPASIGSMEPIEGVAALEAGPMILTESSAASAAELGISVEQASTAGVIYNAEGSAYYGLSEQNLALMDAQAQLLAETQLGSAESFQTLPGELIVNDGADFALIDGAGVVIDPGEVIGAGQEELAQIAEASIGMNVERVSIPYGYLPRVLNWGEAGDAGGLDFEAAAMEAESIASRAPKCTICGCLKKTFNAFKNLVSRSSDTVTMPPNSSAVRVTRYRLRSNFFRSFGPSSGLDYTANDFKVGLLLAGIAASEDWNMNTTAHAKRDEAGNKAAAARTHAKSVGNRLFVARRGPTVDRQYQKKGCKESLGFDPARAVEQCNQAIKDVADALRAFGTVKDDPSGLARQIMETFGGKDAVRNANAISLWAANPPDLAKKLDEINMSAFTSQFWADGQCLMICTYKIFAAGLSCDDEHSYCPPGTIKICQNQCYDALNRDNEALHGLDRLRQPPWQLDDKALMKRAWEIHLRKDPGRFSPGLISMDLSDTSTPQHAPIPHIVTCESAFIQLKPLNEPSDGIIPYSCGDDYGSDTVDVLNALGFYELDDEVRKRIFKDPHDQLNWATERTAVYIASMCRVYFGGLYPEYREKDGKRYGPEKAYCEKTLADIDNMQKAGEHYAELDRMVCNNLKHDVKVPHCNGHKKDLPFCNALKALKKKCKNK